MKRNIHLETWAAYPLVYRKVCKLGHQTSSGRNVKKAGQGCLGCSWGLPENSTYPVEFTNVSEPPPHKNKKYFTDEERRRSRVEQQMRWNARNPDKVKKYTEKYNSKPERRELAKQRWANMDPEKKQQILERQKQRYQEKKLQKEQNEHTGT